MKVQKVSKAIVSTSITASTPEVRECKKVLEHRVTSMKNWRAMLSMVRLGRGNIGGYHKDHPTPQLLRLTSVPQVSLGR